MFLTLLLVAQLPWHDEAWKVQEKSADYTIYLCPHGNCEVCRKTATLSTKYAGPDGDVIVHQGDTVNGYTFDRGYYFDKEGRAWKYHWEHGQYYYPKPYSAGWYWKEHAVVRDGNHAVCHGFGWEQSFSVNDETKSYPLKKYRLDQYGRPHY